MAIFDRHKYKKLAAEIEDLRDVGTITVKIVETFDDAGDVFDKLDQFVAVLGFEPIGKRWVELNLEQAQTFVARILQQDLAYHYEIMPLGKAELLTEQFFDFFDRDQTRFFTNGNFYKFADSFGWTSLRSAATFDTGIVCFDSHLTGFLWVEDED